MDIQLPDHQFQDIDFTAELKSNLLVAVFIKTNSINYPLAVQIARSANRYGEAKVSGKLVHFSAFENSRDGASQALALLDYIRDWRSTKVFAGARLVQSPWRVEPILRCYLAATACNDWKAYCLRVVDDPRFKRPISLGMTIKILAPGEIPTQPEIPETPEKYLFPCRLIHAHHVIDPSHPSSMVDQIQAGAIEYGCEWCPNFNADNFRKVDQAID